MSSWDHACVDFYRGIQQKDPVTLQNAISALASSVKGLKFILAASDPIEYARRLVFMSYAKIDADEVEAGREYLNEAIRLFSPPDLSCPEELAALQSACSELLMTYEEIGDMTSCQELVKTFMKAGVPFYSSPFQRSGHLVSSLQAKPWWDAFSEDPRMSWIGELTLPSNVALIKEEVGSLMPDRDFTKIGDGGRME
ncbi:hypothetical protein TrRE_jg7999, partial [Triparma retinervis]